MTREQRLDLMCDELNAFTRDYKLPALSADELLAHLQDEETTGEDWHREIRWLKGFIDSWRDMTNATG